LKKALTQSATQLATTQPETPILEPLAVNIREAERLSGLSSRTLYRAMAAGRIRAVKRGTTTLILMESLRTYIGGLPPATFRESMVTKAA
jgi:hypothetical protein